MPLYMPHPMAVAPALKAPVVHCTVDFRLFGVEIIGVVCGGVAVVGLPLYYPFFPFPFAILFR